MKMKHIEAVRRYIKNEMLEIQRQISPQQHQIIDKINNHIYYGIYNLKKTDCPCGNDSFENLSQTDTFGFPLNYVICSKCGIIRQEKCLDDSSLKNFYQYYFRNLYRRSGTVNQKFFYRQYRRALSLVELIKSKIEINGIKTVLDYGCSAGGYVKVFEDMGLNSVGLDFDKNYIDFGRKFFGLNLKFGGLEKIKETSFDLIILNHVLEHMSQPLNFIESTKNLLTKNGYLMISVPSYDNFYYRKKQPLSAQFHIAHIYVYSPKNLSNLMSNLGFTSIYLNKKIEAIFTNKNSEIPAASSSEAEKIITFFYNWFQNPLFRNWLTVSKAWPYRMNHAIRKQRIKAKLRNQNMSSK